MRFRKRCVVVNFAGHEALVETHFGASHGVHRPCLMRQVYRKGNHMNNDTNESVPLITEWAFEHTPDHDECVVCRVRNHNNKENN